MNRSEQSVNIQRHKVMDLRPWEIIMSLVLAFAGFGFAIYWAVIYFIDRSESSFLTTPFKLGRCNAPFLPGRSACQLLQITSGGRLVHEFIALGITSALLLLSALKRNRTFSVISLFLGTSALYDALLSLALSAFGIVLIFVAWNRLRNEHPEAVMKTDGTSQTDGKFAEN